MSTQEIFILSLLAGAIICTIWSMLYPYIPKLKVGKVEVFPSIRVHFKAKVVHVHHWLYYSVILIMSVFIENGFLASIPVRGYLTGALLKEIFFPPRKNLVPRKLVYRSYDTNK